MVASHGTPHLQAKGFKRGFRTVERQFIGHMYNEAEAVPDAIDTLPTQTLDLVGLSSTQDP